MDYQTADDLLGKKVFFKHTLSSPKGLVGAFSGESHESEVTVRGEVVATRVFGFWKQRVLVVAKFELGSQQRYKILDFDDVIIEPEKEES